MRNRAPCKRDDRYQADGSTCISSQRPPKQMSFCDCSRPRSSSGNGSNWARRSQKVLCSSPHSLHVNGTRVCPWATDTRFSPPHFLHLPSMRVGPCFTVRLLRSKASFTRRSVSSRIACFDISYSLAFSTSGRAGGEDSFRLIPRSPRRGRKEPINFV
jgi:hypothetical protein